MINPLALTQDPALWYPAQTLAASRKKAGGPLEKESSNKNNNKNNNDDNSIPGPAADGEGSQVVQIVS